MMEKPDVDHIEGLSPAISIEQKSTSHNPRSTVGTITEIHDYLRLLFAKTGQPRCPDHGTVLEAQTISQMVDTVLALPADTKVMILAPVVQLRKKHTIEVVIDRIKVREELRVRLAESFETATRLANGIAAIAFIDEPKRAPKVFSSRFACSVCGYSLTELSPRLFSFNSPIGACTACDGLGIKEVFDPDLVINDTLSLADGAIRGWDRRNQYYYQILTTLAKHYKFSLEVPFKKLGKKIQNVLMYGGGDPIKFQYKDDDYSYTKTTEFEGVMNNLERRYRNTESDFVRDELRKYLAIRPCESCGGARLNVAARNVFVANKNLPEIAGWPVDKAKAFFEKLELPGYRGEIAIKIVKELVSRLSFLVDVGLDYISLARSADTLSGGEAQRIRLASQIGSGLVGVMYILDEPSIGLHQRDNERLLRTLHHLRDLGNSVIVVEHDEDAIMHADHVIDLGPGAGVHGGEIVAQGKPADIMKAKGSLTGEYLSGKRKIEVPKERKPVNPEKLIVLSGAKGNNLKNIDVSIPVGLMTCITGVSGSGKSTLINDTLAPIASHLLNGAGEKEAAPHDDIEGLEYFDKTVIIDQSPIGRTPRSNPATYTGLFTIIRDLFAGTQEARSRGYATGRFSFNVKGGRCEPCQGEGLIKVEMHFLADVYVTCDVCQGKRYNRETLEIFYKGKNIHQVLEMTVEEARAFCDAIPSIARKLQTLVDVGLSYISVGQSATTLSGGEAQRIKLAKELSRKDTGRVLYLLDEPTTGLHFYDIEQLLRVLHRLRDQGNTIVIIEHTLHAMVRLVDRFVVLDHGAVLAEGPPADITRNPAVVEAYLGKEWVDHA